MQDSTSSWANERHTSAKMKARDCLAAVQGELEARPKPGHDILAENRRVHGKCPRRCKKPGLHSALRQHLAHKREHSLMLWSVTANTLESKWATRGLLKIRGG